MPASVIAAGYLFSAPVVCRSPSAVAADAAGGMVSLPGGPGLEPDPDSIKVYRLT